MQYSEAEFEQKNQDSQQKMIRGSIWMTTGSIVSRLLGVIYIIPWYAWMGENGDVANSLFNKGYNVYALFLMVSTAGIPGAIAKQISHYNSKNEYGVSKKLFEYTMLVMVGLGIFFGGIMFFASPWLAQGNKDLIPTMRALSAAILILPSMSVIRGFFQGNHDMMPSAVSQIIEQIARVFYILIATYIIIKVMDGNYVTAVTHSTFAAFIGALASLGALFWFYRLQAPVMDELVENSYNQVDFTPAELIKEIISEAIPFVIIASAITAFKLFDQFTFERMMASFTNYTPKQLEEMFSIFSANPDKLTMITISMATSMAMTSLPLITEAFTEKNKKGLAQLVSNNFQLFFFILIPATFGMIIVAEPLYTVVYRHNLLGSSLLVQACYIGLILGFYLLVSSTLQGLYGNKQAIAHLVVGFLVKMILQYPLIRIFEVYGPLLATAFGFAIAGFLTTRSIRRITNFDLSLTARRTLLILIFSLVMALVAWLVRTLLYLFLSPATKISATIILILVASIGAAVYLYLSLKVGLADRLLGERVAKIRNRLGIKPL